MLVKFVPSFVVQQVFDAHVLFVHSASRLAVRLAENEFSSAFGQTLCITKIFRRIWKAAGTRIFNKLSALSVAECSPPRHYCVICISKFDGR